MPILPNQSIVAVAAAQTYNVGRSAQQATPSAPSALGADPEDLVERALAILAEQDSVRSDKAASNDRPLPRRALGAQAYSVDLQLQRRVLSDGTEVPLPIRYFDDQCLIATFSTDLNRAAELLKGTGLQAVPQEEGEAVEIGRAHV